MSDFQKGLNNIIAAIRKALSARGRGLENASISYDFKGSGPDDAKIAIVAPGKTAEAQFPRKYVEDSYQSVPVSVQIRINSLVSAFEVSGNG
jgi:hypothetical protein